jgi:uncharacterized repeat protein (TIGR04076 family)
VELTIHVDGGARGNPGPAGAGVVIHDQDGGLVFEGAYFLGRQTNNAAEYHALVYALERAQQAGANRITVYSDSELLVRQLTGAYQVKSPRLIDLFEQAQRMLLKVPRWAVRHIPREENQRADELANLAMDRRENVIVFDAAEGGGDPAPAAESEPPSAVEAGPEEASESEGEARREPHGVRVTVAQTPDPEVCPSQVDAGGFTIRGGLPGGLCVHAAHAILPTVLAMMNMKPDEFAAVPTLTVRCSQPDCGAVFQLSPERGANGRK